MKDELETSMRLLGMTDVSQAHPRYLNTCDIDGLVPESVDGTFEEISLPTLVAKL